MDVTKWTVALAGIASLCCAGCCCNQPWGSGGGTTYAAPAAQPVYGQPAYPAPVYGAPGTAPIMPPAAGATAPPTTQLR